MLFVCLPKIMLKHCLQFLLGVKVVPRETENNAYAKVWGDKQRALWYVTVCSGVVNRRPCSLYMKLAKLPVNDKNTASRQTNTSPSHYSKRFTQQK